MPWLRFTETHRFTPADRRTSVKYLAGSRHNVKREWAAEMVALGVAKAIRAPTALQRAQGAWPEEMPDDSGTASGAAKVPATGD